MMLQNTNVILNPLKADDAALVNSWFSNPKITEHMFYGQRPKTDQQIADWIEQDIASDANDAFLIKHIL